MDLATYLSRYPNVRVATRDDNERILAFYKKLSMQGGAFNILFLKDPDYFRYLAYESANHAVAIVEDDAGTLEGMFTFAARPCYVDGRREGMVHVSDLRFARSRDRKTKFDWKLFGRDLCADVAKIDDFGGARYVLGSFVMANKRAREAIASQKTPFDISPIANYKMVNIFARRPLKRMGLGGKMNGVGDFHVAVSRGTEADREPLRAFLDKQHRRRALGFVFEGPDDELTRRLKTWDGFSMGSFFLARDGAGKIIGCFAPWDISPGRRIVIDKFPKALAAAASVLRPLIKKVPRPGDELRILYLTTQEIDLDLTRAQRNLVFRSLLDALYDSGMPSEFHMVALCDYDHDSLREEVDPRYFTSKTDTMLYQLCERGSSTVIRESDLKWHAGHEMCLT
ncbi:MAG TPA: hypothetical protein VGG33_27975 [Polyangia bacterium]